MSETRVPRWPVSIVLGFHHTSSPCFVSVRNTPLPSPLPFYVRQKNFLHHKLASALYWPEVVRLHPMSPLSSIFLLYSFLCLLPLKSRTNHFIYKGKRTLDTMVIRHLLYDGSLKSETSFRGTFLPTIWTRIRQLPFKNFFWFILYWFYRSIFLIRPSGSSYLILPFFDPVFIQCYFTVKCKWST